MTVDIKSAAADAEYEAAARLNELLFEAARGTTMERGAYPAYLRRGATV